MNLLFNDSESVLCSGVSENKIIKKYYSLPSVFDEIEVKMVGTNLVNSYHLIMTIQAIKLLYNRLLITISIVIYNIFKTK